MEEEDRLRDDVAEAALGPIRRFLEGETVQGLREMSEAAREPLSRAGDAVRAAVRVPVGGFYQTLLKSPGAVIIILCLHVMGLVQIGLLYREARFHADAKPAGILGAYVIGLAFAFGWTPCVGPVLAAILFVAGAEDSVGEGVRLLAVYSAGLGIPFMAAALAVKPFMGFMGRFRRHMLTIERVIGGVLVITGVMFLTGTIADVAFWLLETFPALGKTG